MRLRLSEVEDRVRKPRQRWQAELAPGDRAVLGRARDCGLWLLDDAKISRRELEIWDDNGRWCFRPLHAKPWVHLNGVSLNDDRFRNVWAHLLNAGDILVVGETWLQVELIPEQTH